MQGVDKFADVVYKREKHRIDSMGKQYVFSSIDEDFNTNLYIIGVDFGFKFCILF